MNVLHDDVSLSERVRMSSLAQKINRCMMHLLVRPLIVERAKRETPGAFEHTLPHGVLFSCLEPLVIV